LVVHCDRTFTLSPSLQAYLGIKMNPETISHGAWFRTLTARKLQACIFLAVKYNEAAETCAMFLYLPLQVIRADASKLLPFQELRVTACAMTHLLPFKAHSICVKGQVCVVIMWHLGSVCLALLSCYYFRYMLLCFHFCYLLCFSLSARFILFSLLISLSHSMPKTPPKPFDLLKIPVSIFCPSLIISRERSLRVARGMYFDVFRIRKTRL
jgi:hypothetical protein